MSLILACIGPQVLDRGRDAVGNKLLIEEEPDRIEGVGHIDRDRREVVTLLSGDSDEQPNEQVLQWSFVEDWWSLALPVIKQLALADGQPLSASFLIGFLVAF